jgi:hypothetical protein
MARLVGMLHERSVVQDARDKRRLGAAGVAVLVMTPALVSTVIAAAAAAAFY